MSGCENNDDCTTCPLTQRDMDLLGQAIVSQTRDADGRVVSCERVDPLRATLVDGLIVHERDVT